MRSLMRLQMRALGINFLTSEELALVYPPFGIGRMVQTGMMLLRRRRRRYTTTRITITNRWRPRGHHRDVARQTGSPNPNDRVPVRDAQSANVQVTRARAFVAEPPLARFRTRGRS